MLDLPRNSTNREATRYLAAATQVDIRYAEIVVSEVVNERFKALAPTFGVEVPVVARWAIKALRTRAHRDYVLSGILLAIVLVLALAFLSLSLLTVLPLLIIASWTFVSWEFWERIHNTVVLKMLRGRFDPDDAPEPSRAAAIR